MKKKILIVDSESRVLDILRFLLDPKGFQIVTAENDLDGMREIRSNIFDVVFWDINMSDINGKQILKTIREIRPSQIVVIYKSNANSNANFKNSYMIN